MLAEKSYGRRNGEEKREGKEIEKARKESFEVRGWFNDIPGDPTRSPLDPVTPDQQEEKKKPALPFQRKPFAWPKEFYTFFSHSRMEERSSQRNFRIGAKRQTNVRDTSLDLANPARWNLLLPLVRPSVQTLRTSKGQMVLVDAARARSDATHVVLVGTPAKFSSKVLDDSCVTAVVMGQSDGVDVQDVVRTVPHAAGDAGKGKACVVVKVAKERGIRSSADAVEVDVEGELVADHLLHVLGHATESCRASVEQMQDLLKQFVGTAVTATSRFHVQKVGGSPAVLHAHGVQSFTGAKQSVEHDLKSVLERVARVTGDVLSIHYSDINGLSRLENYILAKDLAEYCESQGMTYHISHSTVLDHDERPRGFGVSIAKLPPGCFAAQAKPQRHQARPGREDAKLKSLLSPPTSIMVFDDVEVRRRIEAGCAALIQEEPTITEYDTIVGDGDCGYTLRDGAKQVLSFIAGKDLTRLPETVSALVHDLEVNMGGTSGALYCIFLTALSQTLATEQSVPAALQGALQQLLKYTRARLGDRTMMDALIPFIETLARTGDVGTALTEAQSGVQGTRKMEAKLGRSTYLDASATDGVPDPGAYGLLVLLKGMAA
nr:dihydroxyacetone kinase [Quercus suber]